MILGLGWPCYEGEATFSMVSGSADAGYAVANLGDVAKPARPFRASASGAIAFKAELPAARLLRLISLVRHNALNGGTYRIRGYAGAGLTTLVVDSGVLAFSLGSSFKPVTPFLFEQASIRSVRVDVSDPGVALQIGGVGLSGFWDLSNLSDLGRGIDARDDVRNLAGGADHAEKRYQPRTADLTLSVIDTTTDGQTLLDFTNDRGTDLPFVYVRDASDPATWPRECFLARLSALAQLNEDAASLGSFRLGLVEHLQ